MIDPMMRTVRPESVLTPVSTANPMAALTNPPPIRCAGGTRREIPGTTMEPRMKPSIEGSVAKPAYNDDKPSTSWRYWAMKM